MKITMTAAEGRAFICIGPNVWGKGKDAETAIKNAKKEFGGGRGWKYLLYDVQDDAVIDDMGSICYVPREGVTPYQEVLRAEPAAGRKVKPWLTD